MKKLLLILLCLPMIGFGQDFSYNQLINIKDIKTFEKIMYEKGIRFIEKSNYYEYRAKNLTDSGAYTLDFKWGDKEFDVSSEFYEKNKSNRSYFGRNYNSNKEVAEVFYKMNERSNFQNYNTMSDKSIDNTGYEYNYIKFSVEFADKSEYKKFWNTIDIPLVYSNTNKDGKRIYEYKNLFFKIKEYDETVNIEIYNHLSLPIYPRFPIWK